MNCLRETDVPRSNSFGLFDTYFVNLIAGLNIRARARALWTACYKRKIEKRNETEWVIIALHRGVPKYVIPHGITIVEVHGEIMACSSRERSMISLVWKLPRMPRRLTRIQKGWGSPSRPLSKGRCYFGLVLLFVANDQVFTVILHETLRPTLYTYNSARKRCMINYQTVAMARVSQVLA